MIITLAHNHFNAGHLAEVVAEMEVLGAPTIRVYDLGFEGRYQAVEGCHRLRACEVLGIDPIIEEISEHSIIQELGLDYEAIDGAEVNTIGDWENYSIVV